MHLTISVGNTNHTLISDYSNVFDEACSSEWESWTPVWVKGIPLWPGFASDESN